MKIPRHWKLVTLSDIAKWASGGTPKSTVKEYYYGDIPWLVIGDLNDSYVTSAHKKITKLGLENSSAKIIQPDSVLVAMYGSIGKLAINKVPLSCNQAIAYTKELSSDVYPLFLFYYLMSIRAKLHSLGKGGTQKNISQTVLKKVVFPLPPLDEQKRIVAKIESLLSELDRSIESLKRTKEKLKRYRQAVLKAAFEGKLTEEWRKAHAHELEDAQTLLERIKQERQAAYEDKLAEWEAEVKAWEENGKVGKRPAKPKKPKELPPLSEEELAVLPELPEGWKWIRLLNITRDFSLGKMLDKQKNKGILKPYIGNINVRWGSFDLHNLKEMRFEKSELYKYELKKGDLIVCEGGEPGRCAVWNIDKSGIGFQKALHRVRFSLQNIMPEFIYYHFLYSSQNGKLKGFFTGTTIKHLTGQGLSKVEIPICSKKEQIVLVESIQKLFSEADFMEKTIDASLKKAESLRQSILKNAFCGKLI